MSGHSHFANIKRTKEKSDAVKGKIFTKIAREIAVCVKTGGSDPGSNPRLKDIITKARQNGIPFDTVERSIKKASGEVDTVHFESMVYEGYGISGSAVIVETLTDNKNRTAGDLRHLFDKYGGALGVNGCVMYFFNKNGVIITDKEKNEDDVMMLALETGALDFNATEEYYEIITSVELFSEILSALEKEKVNIVSSEIAYLPQNTIKLSESDQTRFNIFLEKLDEHDDVQNVFHNVELN